MIIPVLMYHKIIESNNVRDKYEVTKSTFTIQIQYLKEKGYQVIAIEDLESNLSIYNKPLIITFDDGSENDLAVALPVLQEYGFKSIHFITTRHIGKEGFMTWNQVKKLREAGASIQSHTATHRKLEGLSEEEIKQELSLSKHKIEKETGDTPVALALPMGSRPERIKQLLQECGYKYLFTSRPRVNDFSGKETVAEFGRLRITEDMDTSYFKKILNPGSFFYRKEHLLFMLKRLLKKILKKKDNY